MYVHQCGRSAAEPDGVRDPPLGNLAQHGRLGHEGGEGPFLHEGRDEHIIYIQAGRQADGHIDMHTHIYIHTYTHTHYSYTDTSAYMYSDYSGHRLGHGDLWIHGSIDRYLDR